MLRILSRLAVFSLAFALLAAPTPAAAASCRNHGGAASNFSYSSQVNGTVFTLCGKAILRQLAAVKSRPRTKPTAVPSPQPTRRPVVVSKPKVKKRSDDGLASFAPKRPVASVSVSEPIQSGEQAQFTVDSVTQLRATNVLGHPARVKFRPVRFGWQFSDFATAKGRSPFRSFEAEGVFLAVASVEFEVSYRFVGQAQWARDPDHILLVSNRVEVVVGQRPAIARKPVLVNRNCLLNANAPGCRNP